MCGIAGLINKNNKPVSKDVILRINNAASHRGPDAENYFIKNNFALAHRRLSILDLSTTSDQPMHRYGLTIIFNGEIFNYLEIKDELLGLGHTFKTKSDTEVILAAYREWGYDCPSHFNGMWSFCIYDEEKQKFFCSRDRFGIKPFYFINDENHFSFASEIKQLLTLFDKNKANKKALAEFIVGAEDYGIETFFEGIYRLLPAYNLEISLTTGEFRTWQYYQIEKVNVPIDYESCLQEYKSLLTSSISLRLRSDVKVGTCLSGGLDSSAIAAMASKEYLNESGESFCSIHAKSSEKQTDESEYAKMVAEHSHLNMFMVEPGKNSFSKILEKIIRIQDEPFGGPSIVMQYFVFEEAARRDIIVMLDGQGGDETLIGYDSYFNMYLSIIPGVRNIIKCLKLNKSTLFKANIKFAYCFKGVNSFIKRKLHKKKFLFLNSHYFDKVDYGLIIDKALRHCENAFLFQKFEMEYSIQKLLRYEDRNSMYHGIESRLPFLDHRLVEYSLSLPVEYKLKDNYTKHILREAMIGIVPENVIYRNDKKGFEAPSIFWKQYLKETEQDIRNSKIVNDMLVGDIPTDRQLAWRFANIAAWEKAYNVML
jgi:asparagine synthase (glutamine-hydrolysing)